jgi:hypothetical protein
LSALFTAAFAADVTWDTIIRLTTNSASQVTGYSSQHGVAVDAAGNVHVAWLDQRTVPYQIWYRRYDAGTSTWLAETALTTQQANCSRPGMACDSAGNIHLVWHVGSWNPLGVGIWSKRYNATTHHWRADTLIDSTSTSQPQQYPSVACVPGTGDAEVAWYGSPDTGMFSQVFLRERYPTTGWDSSMQVSSAAVSHDQVSVAAGHNGDLAVVWVGKDFGNDYNQIYCRRRVAGTWQGGELVSDIPSGLDQYSPCVAFGPEVRFHVVWYGRSLMNTYYQVFHRECDSSGWSAIDSISGERAYQQQYPSVACDVVGRCHAVWCSQTGGSNYQLAYVQRDTDGVWGSPTILTVLDSGSVSYPSITCDADSGIHIVWYDDHTGNQDVYYLRGVTPAGVAEPRLSSPVLRTVAAATLVRGVLFLSEASSRKPQAVSLMDATGRKVLDLKPGANDVRALARGVYFVREGVVSGEQGGVGIRKVVITR